MQYNFLYKLGFLPSPAVTNLNDLYPNTFFVSSLSHLPSPVNGVIIIPSDYNVLLLSPLDLQGNRLYFEHNSSLTGLSSERTHLWSSLTGNNALITAVGSLPIKHIALSVYPETNGVDTPVILNLNAIGNSLAALDWLNVNLTGSENLGYIRNYSNVVLSMCAFIGTTNGLILGGTFDSVIIKDSIFRNSLGIGTLLEFEPATVINRRIRIQDSPFQVPAGGIGINLPVSCTVPIESYILKTLNFSGSGTFIAGIDVNDNRSLFIDNNGIGFQNTSKSAWVYLQNNVTATTITNSANYFEMNVPLNVKSLQKFSVLGSTVICEAAISGKYKIDAVVTFTAANNNKVYFKIVKNGNLANAQTYKSTANGSILQNRVENSPLIETYDLVQGDEISIYIRNASSTTDVVVTDLMMGIELVKN